MPEIQKAKPTPPVEPYLVQHTLLLVYAWTEADNEDNAEPPVRLDDVGGLLDRLVAKLDVNGEVAIAAFKRAIALSAFCEKEDLPNTLFDEGFPGQELCTAAAKVTVFDTPGEVEGEMSHSFDTAEMRGALEAAWH